MDLFCPLRGVYKGGGIGFSKFLLSRGKGSDFFHKKGGR